MLLDQNIPVPLCPGPKGFGASGVVAETTDRLVDLDELIGE